MIGRQHLTLATIALFCALVPAQDPSTKPASVFPTDWAERDFEGRWYAYSKAMDADRSSNADWLVALRDAREYAILEWIALTEAGFLAGEILANQDAPNWIRCAAWAAQQVTKFPQRDSHGHGLASRLLTGADRGLPDAWFALHGIPLIKPAAKPPTSEETARAAAYLPPLSADFVLAGLMPPDKVVEFGLRTRAVKGEFYAHQVRRSLAAFGLASSCHVEPWLSRVAALTAHPDPVVRREALLAYSMIDPSVIPVAALVPIARNAREEPATREAAVLALSFAFMSPTAWAEVHRVANDPAHPGFKGAVSRLGDVGDGFSSSRLAFVAGARDVDAAFVKAARDRIDRREAEEAAGALDEARVVAMLLRAAHLTVTVDAMGLSYSAWVKASLTGDRRRATVQRMADRLAGAFTAPANVEMDGFSANGARIPVTAEEINASARTLAAAIVVEMALNPR